MFRKITLLAIKLKGVFFLKDEDRKRLIINNYQLLSNKYDDFYTQSTQLSTAIEEKDFEQIITLFHKRQEIIEQIERIERNLTEYINRFGFSWQELGVNSEKLIQKIKVIIELDKTNQQKLYKLNDELQKEYTDLKNKGNIKKEYEKSSRQIKRRINMKY